MPLTDQQKENIELVCQTANLKVTHLLAAINYPREVILTNEHIDPTEADHNAVNLVNKSKAKAVAFADDLAAYLQSVPDLS